MDQPRYDEISVLVAGLDPPDAQSPAVRGALGRQIRLAKAGVLYADNVTLASHAATMAVGEALRALFKAPTFAESLDAAHGTMRTQEGSSDHILAELWELVTREGAATVLGSRSSDGHDDSDGPVEFWHGLSRGAFWIPDPEQAGYLNGWLSSSASAPPGVIPLLDDQAATRAREVASAVTQALSLSPQERTDRLRRYARSAQDPSLKRFYESLVDSSHSSSSLTASIARREAKVLVEVLGGLPAFPDADWDVLLDIRDRLKPARARFRAVIQESAETLADASDEQFTAACQKLRRQLVAPALADMDEALEELGAIPTLLRVVRDSPTVVAVAANLALATANTTIFGWGALAHGATSAPILASAAREALHRREQRRSIQSSPYWILHEVGRRL